jgi:hypothetical protein
VYYNSFVNYTIPISILVVEIEREISMDGEGHVPRVIG